MFRSLVQRLAGVTGPPSPTRDTGPPTSSNGASSCHLFWDAPPWPLAEVRATIEVVETPTVDKLYFWALQASFETADGRRTGGAHFGLQHHPSYPDAGAVNWGGYHQGGGELPGSTSALPSALDNVNTRTFRWEAGRPYRYRIHRSPEQGWRGSITDVGSGTETVVRDLWVDGEHLMAPMVWTEAFADCDHPPAAVRWSDLEAVDTDGRVHAIERVRINYQSWSDGGCSNTDCSVDGDGWIQRTGTTRTNPAGRTLPRS